MLELDISTGKKAIAALVLMVLMFLLAHLLAPNLLTTVLNYAGEAMAFTLRAVAGVLGFN